MPNYMTVGHHERFWTLKVQFLLFFFLFLVVFVGLQVTCV